LLSEGVVPSNVKTGYLARMLLRKVYRILSEFSCEDKIFDLIRYQIDYWSPYFKHLKAAEKEVLELANVESRKYQRTLEREMEYVTKTMESIKKENKKSVPSSILVEFYESHGIHPLQVKEKAHSMGLEVEVPSDFFSSIVKLHNPKTQIEKVDELEETLMKTDLKSTVKLFYEDTRLFDFNAKVVFVHGNNIVLDKTAFYAESGGQLSDLGKIVWENGEADVNYVKKVGGIIVHEVSRIPPLGEMVTGHVDKERRTSLSIHHTSTHIINGAARKVLGEHVWQAGAQKEVNESRLDITHYENISDEQVKKIENVANEIVREDIPVEIYELPRFEAERRYGYRLYQGGAVPGKELRVIKIGNHDVEACGGTHMRRTGEIGFIKILKVEHIQDGIERIIFAAGAAALNQVQKTFDIVKETSIKLLVPPEKASEMIQRILQENDEQRKKTKKYGKKISEIIIPYIKEMAVQLSNIKFYITTDPDLEEETQIDIGSQAIKNIPALLYCALITSNSVVKVIVFSGEIAQQKGIFANGITKNIAGILGGSGGGDKRFGRGGGSNVIKVIEAKEFLEKYLKEKMM
jgi:alanyl-tRNA synthetase